MTYIVWKGKVIENNWHRFLSFVDLWLYLHSLRFILNFYKLPWKKIIYASIRSSTLKLVNQRVLRFIYIYIHIYTYVIRINVWKRIQQEIPLKKRLVSATVCHHEQRFFTDIYRCLQILRQFFFYYDVIVL